MSENSAPAALNQLSSFRIAVVHDWLTAYAGAERVLEEILHIYPHADIFSIVDFLPDLNRNFLYGRKIYTSFIQNLPRAKTHYRSYLPLMPLAVEQFDLSSYDLVISSSHAVAKGVLTGPDQCHICFCHSPMRYAWDLQHPYLMESGLTHGLKGWLAKYLLHKIRIWDLRTANGVNQFIANSQFIARRIYKTYRRDAEVIYPPVSFDSFTYQEEKTDYYVTIGRLVPYKKIDLIVRAFRLMPNKRLIVIGDGPDFKKIAKQAPPNVTLLGYQPQAALVQYLQSAKAFVYAAEEDFGIALLEAQACGTPVIAFGKGGALETIQGFINQPAPTGLFFNTQTEESIIEALHRFEGLTSAISPINCRNNAARFSQENFRLALSAYIGKIFEQFRRCELKNEISKT